MSDRDRGHPVEPERSSLPVLLVQMPLDENRVARPHGQGVLGRNLLDGARLEGIWLNQAPYQDLMASAPLWLPETTVRPGNSNTASSETPDMNVARSPRFRAAKLRRVALLASTAPIMTIPLTQRRAQRMASPLRRPHPIGSRRKQGDDRPPPGRFRNGSNAWSCPPSSADTARSRRRRAPGRRPRSDRSRG